MENYLVSARKYRPDTFMSVVGQKALTTTLRNAIKNKQLAHAYLFCGPRGVGKTTCARIFAKAINCMHPLADGEACNECESCRSFNEQRSFNIFELDAASNNGVDEIRALTEEVRIPPQLGKYKVYIIDEVHMLTTAAFNAFLKTLEEPPAHAVFVLATTEKHKIIPTILSRCQIYDFHRISVNDIQEHLQYVAQSEGITYEPAALNVIAMKADGGMRDALSIFDQVASFGEGNITYKGVIDNLNVLDYDYYFRLVDFCLKGQVADSLILFNDVLNLGFEGKDFIGGLSSHLRDLLVAKDEKTVPLLEVTDDIRRKYLAQAANCSFDYLFKALQITNECGLQYATAKNKRLLVEICLLRLCNPTTPGPENGKPLEPVKPQTASYQSVPTPQPAPSPQPATAAKPAISPQPASAAPAQPTTTTQQTPAAKPAVATEKPSTLSLNRRKVQTEETPTDEPIHEAEQNEPFTAEDLSRAWKEYAESITDDPQFKIALLTGEPTMLNADTFEFSVSHSNLENHLNSIRPSLERFIHEKLHNTHLHLQVRITEEGEKKLALSPQDQLKVMVENNPAIAEMGRQLGLELE